MIKINGRVITEYVGRGAAGEAAAAGAADARQARARALAASRAERARRVAEDRAVRAWFDRIEAAAEAALIAAGYHKHKGQWRRRRNG